MVNAAHDLTICDPAISICLEFTTYFHRYWSAPAAVGWQLRPQAVGRLFRATDPFVTVIMSRALRRGPESNNLHSVSERSTKRRSAALLRDVQVATSYQCDEQWLLCSGPEHVDLSRRGGPSYDPSPSHWHAPNLKTSSCELELAASPAGGPVCHDDDPAAPRCCAVTAIAAASSAARADSGFRVGRARPPAPQPRRRRRGLEPGRSGWMGHPPAVAPMICGPRGTVARVVLVSAASAGTGPESRRRPPHIRTQELGWWSKLDSKCCFS